VHLGAIRQRRAPLRRPLPCGPFLKMSGGVRFDPTIRGAETQSRGRAPRAGSFEKKMIAWRARFAVIDHFRVCYAETSWILTSLNSWF
jgi:hypothetical protein